ncbi:MAG: putative peptide modification system cyclase [Luteimonas sp.]
MNDSAARHESAVPQLRTLLLTDLCDSTAMVERLGDGAAADLFREHDRLVLELQQRWRGRLIDRSDGLLLLFERPIDGLGFALDYVRGLRTIGENRKLTLQARSGLHVGEVLTWRNSDEAVQVGAKPLEVEGLAKPMAGRLMTLARAGQILMSSTAEPLMHRSARELGERGEHLLWKSYGRWRFKGVPQGQDVYEVGEPGFAPLRAPKNGAKAWRDIPLWRRPAALAAEVLLVIGLGTGAWFVTRPQPAIAFNERDWVVVGDLRNLTGQPVLDESLEQAFRISLEQSRFVNVLSDMKARDTLARMQRKPNTPLDRAVASEIALRDGVRAVILPTVSEVGGRVRVSAEVIDPHTQTTVYAESADGAGIGSALGSIDDVTAALRGRLGETLKAIERDSAPLPQVTTKNLDALRAYALGQNSYAHNRYSEALQFYRRATELDPKFALAWLGQAKADHALLNAAAAVPALRKAQSLQARLPPRDAMYLDGWAAEFDAPSKALEKWRLMGDLYPDFPAAQANTANRLLRLNRFTEAMKYARRATVTQNPLAANAYDLLGRSLLATEQYRGAANAFSRAVAGGNRDSLPRRAEVAAAQGKFAEADALLRKSPEQTTIAYERALFAIDTKHWDEARKSSAQALQSVSKEPETYWLVNLYAVAVTDWLAGDLSLAKNHAKEVADRALASLSTATSTDAQELVGVALSAALLAQRLDDRNLAGRVLKDLDGNRQFALADLAELATVVRAQQQRLEGKPENAIALLLPLLTGYERYQTHVALFDAYADAGRTADALKQSHWLRLRRGLAYAEVGCYQCQQALNIGNGYRVSQRAAQLVAAGVQEMAAK